MIFVIKMDMRTSYFEDKIDWFNTRELPIISEDEIATFEQYPYYNETLPEFIRMIYEEGVFTDSSKDDFRINFVEYYLNNQLFQEYVKTHIILFVNLRFYGIFKNVENAIKQGELEDIRNIYRIAGNLCKYGYKEIFQSETDDNEVKMFRLNCTIKNFADENEENIEYNITFLYDTGSSDCEFNIADEFSRRTGRFEINRLNQETGQIEVDQRFVDLNSRITSIESVSYRTASGTIIKNYIVFNPPMYIKIENEGYSELRSVIVPKLTWYEKLNCFKCEQINRLPLLGLSVTNQFWTISCPSNNFGLLVVKICPFDKKGFRTCQLSKDIILYSSPFGNHFSIFYDVYKIRNYYEYLKDKYRHINFSNFESRIDENAYKNICETDIYYTIKKLNLIILNSDEEVPFILEELDDPDTIYSGYVISYDLHSCIYFTNCSKFLDNLENIEYFNDDMIKPIYKHEIGFGFIFI